MTCHSQLYLEKRWYHSGDQGVQEWGIHEVSAPSVCFLTWNMVGGIMHAWRLALVLLFEEATRWSYTLWPTKWQFPFHVDTAELQSLCILGWTESCSNECPPLFSLSSFPTFPFLLRRWCLSHFNERPLQTAQRLDHAATRLMLQDSTALPSELIPAAAYQIAPFPFSLHQYHTQTDMDLVQGMAFAFEVLF